MPTKQEEELVKLVEKNADILTPRTVTDFVWCAKHEEEILKMMGLIPCSTDELYRITSLFLSEGQTSLFVAIRYRSTYGRAEQEKAEEAKRVSEYIKRNPQKENAHMTMIPYLNMRKTPSLHGATTTTAPLL